MFLEFFNECVTVHKPNKNVVNLIEDDEDELDEKI
jgi:hypothetical protein